MNHHLFVHQVSFDSKGPLIWHNFALQKTDEPQCLVYDQSAIEVTWTLQLRKKCEAEGKKDQNIPCFDHDDLDLLYLVSKHAYCQPKTHYHHSLRALKIFYWQIQSLNQVSFFHLSNLFHRHHSFSASQIYQVKIRHCDYHLVDFWISSCGCPQDYHLDYLAKCHWPIDSESCRSFLIICNFLVTQDLLMAANPCFANSKATSFFHLLLN